MVLSNKDQTRVTRHLIRTNLASLLMQRRVLQFFIFLARVFSSSWLSTAAISSSLHHSRLKMLLPRWRKVTRRLLRALMLRTTPSWLEATGCDNGHHHH